MIFLFICHAKASQFPKPGGTLIVNVGEQLSAMSNDRFKATIHRVLDIGKDRYVQFENFNFLCRYFSLNDSALTLNGCNR